MKILKIVGVSDADQRAAVEEFIAIVTSGGGYNNDLLQRLPSTRIEVQVSSDADDNRLAIIIIEDGVFTFEPLDAARTLP